MHDLEVATWFHHQGQRWGSYDAQARATPWPQATTLCAPERGLFVAASGGGGGSQQALFHDELQAYLHSGLSGWAHRAPIEAYFLAIQAAFDAATEPPFCDHFQGTAVAARVETGHVEVGNLGCERAYLLTGEGEPRRLTEDRSLGAELDDDDPSPTAALLRTMAASWFRMGAGETARPEVTRAEWGPGHTLLLITAVAPLGPAADAVILDALHGASQTPLERLRRDLVLRLKASTADADQRQALDRRMALVLLRQGADRDASLPG